MMKRTLYVFIVIVALGACKKSSTPPGYSFKTVMDSLGLQFGTQYAYRHFTDSILYETGFITFNSDSSFIEIMNADTFYYHARIIYTYDPQSGIIHLPATGTISGEAGGLKYIYTPKITTSTAFFLGDAFLAWCCYSRDSVKGNPNHYLPLAYYLQKSAPVFLGIDAGHVRIAPTESKDSIGFPLLTTDKIIIEN